MNNNNSQTLKNRILIVDDLPTNVLLMKEILGRFYTIATATCGEDALEIIPNFRPDMILLDIMMPGMDGYEVCTKIRENNDYRYIKVILISAKTTIEERLQGYESGADDYITKPFVTEELLAKVRVFSRLKYEEELHELKDNLLTLFSHETKTPLSGIIGLSDILMRNDVLDDSIKERIQMISEKAYQLLGFIEKSALICSLKSGKELIKSNAFLATNIQSEIDNAESSRIEHRVAMDVYIPEDIEFDADWLLFNKAIGYLIDNAIRFSYKGGQVTIRARKRKNYCFIQIADKGIGIKPDRIDNIFNTFNIHDITHHQKGQGLSLAIVKHIIDLHEGKIMVDSNVEIGSTFTIRMPLNENDHDTV